MGRHVCLVELFINLACSKDQQTTTIATINTNWDQLNGVNRPKKVVMKRYQLSRDDIAYKFALFSQSPELKVPKNSNANCHMKCCKQTMMSNVKLRKEIIFCFSIFHFFVST
jgi:hypothetical protein